MKILRSILFYLSLAAIIGILGVIFVNPQYPVVLTQAQVQVAIDKKLPFVSPPIKTLVFTVPPGALVTFLPDGRVGVTANFSAKPVFTQESHFEGQLKATGNIVYSGSSFYIRNLQLQDIGGHLVLSARAQVVGTLLDKWNDKLKDKLDIPAESLDKLLNVDSIRDKLPAYLAGKLATVPVYNLEDHGPKLWLASQALESVTVTDQTLTITLGAGTLTLHLLLFAAIVCLAVVMAFGILLSGSATALGSLAALAVFS